MGSGFERFIGSRGTHSFPSISALWIQLEHARQSASEIALFLELGIDGYFTDHPGIGAAAMSAFERRGNN